VDLFLKILFWLSLFILFYSYLGYGIIIWFLIKMRSVFKGSRPKINEEKNDFKPSITFLVAAFNEQDYILEKIRNTLSLNYPSNLLEIMIVTDGSSDDTEKIVSAFPSITHLHEQKRAGKIHAIHRAMSFVQSDIVVFSDANTMVNQDALLHIAKHYADPKIGGVAGEKKVISTHEDANAANTEGLYWKYESALKKLDSDFYSVVGAAGELFSVRSKLYEYPGENTLLDDFVISLRICEKGYKIVYEPNAYAIESPSFNLEEEKKRKIRISAGGFQSIAMLSPLLNPLKHGVLSFQYLSHRVLRWAFCPFLLPVVLLTNLLIVAHSPYDYIYLGLLIGQISFYLIATIGKLLENNKKIPKIIKVTHYFVFINYALYLGFLKYRKGNQSVLWDKAKRTNNSTTPHQQHS